jgi:hypothetical protein
MSETYQQTSKVPAGWQEDPANYFLARGPRFRLTAEQIRDQALAVSGLLSRKMYGPSVMPHQPEGIWNVVYSGLKWKTSEGEDRFRRGLYTYWRRTTPYTSLLPFDMPSREVCVNRRIRTNTPIQALVTLNDPVYVEAAQALADKMQELPGSLEKQIEMVYEDLFLEKPATGIVKVLTGLAGQTEQDSTVNALVTPAALLKENPGNPETQDHYFKIANVMLNLDKTLTKE